MEETNGRLPSCVDVRQPLVTQPETTDDTDAVMQDTHHGKLSPDSTHNMELVQQKLLSGQASWSRDAAGNLVLVYENPRNVLLNYVDKSQANLIATPKSEKDTQNRIEACLEMITFTKNNRAPKGVVLDKTKIHTQHGKYREGEDHEFTKLDQILGSGAMAGDIVVVKDNKTEAEHAQKTVMISEFREEEVRAWVDLDGDGLCPSLYKFCLEDNRIVFRMEKLERAITLRDVIDSHMKKLHEQEPDLVRPFSLYVFQGLLTSVRHMHDRNWTHRDLHAGNVMLQEKEAKLQLKILDFGKANRLRGKDGYDLSGEQDDIYQVIRLFSSIYLGQEFESAHDLKENYRHHIREIQGLSMEAKTEVFQLIDAAMSVAESGKKMDDTIQEIGDKLREKVDVDNMMKRVAAIMFNEEEYLPVHGGDIGVMGDGGVDVCDAAFDLREKAASVPDEFIQKLRLGIEARRQG